MKEALQIIEEQRAIRIQVDSQQNFDLSVLSQSAQPDLYLECSAQNSEQGWIEYSTDGMISLEAFVREIELNRAESCAFLDSLFTPLAAGLKNQPVILDTRAVFLSPKGDQVRLTRAPVILEVWMKRQEEIEQFLMKLMDILPSDSLEIFGLLWKGVRRHLQFEDLLDDLSELYQSGLRRRLFSRKQPIPPYCSRKAVFAVSTPETGSKKESMNRFVRSGMEGDRSSLNRRSDDTCLPFDDEKAVCFEPAAKSCGFSDRRIEHFEPWQEDLFTRVDASLFSSGHSEKTEAERFLPESVDTTGNHRAAAPRFARPTAADELFENEPPAFSAQSGQSVVCSEKRGERSTYGQTERSSACSDINCTLLLDSLELSDWLEMDGQRFTLEGTECLIGRGAQCAIQLSDPSVSSAHARLVCQQGRWYIQDLKSTNGTWLNEKRVIRRMRLREGMVIRFGNRTALSMSSRYMIVETLRRTPGTEVFLAMDTLKRSKVILKRVRPDAHPAWRMQFRTEVQILSRLDCEWIPSLIESADDIRGSWLCEEYIEGMALDLWLAGRPSKRQRREVFEQILQLIARVHQIGYLYMDLKADNVLIRNSHACLIDFNACLPIGSTRPVLTNRDSLPPEGLAGKTMDERADQIGLGKLWLQMAGPSQAAWTALSKNPEKRFRSLEQFAQAVHRTRRVPAFLAAGLAVCAGVSALSQPLSQSWQAAAESALSSETDPLPPAAEFCQRLVHQTGEQAISAVDWLVAAQSALQDSHFALAGWLSSHPPAEDSTRCRYYQFLLALMLGTDTSTRDLKQILDEFPDQLGWSEEISDLFKGLIRRKIVLEPDLIRRLLSRLSEESALRPDCLECLMNYLLQIYSETGLLFELPASLSRQLETKATDLYSLYQRAWLGKKQDAASKFDDRDQQP